VSTKSGKVQEERLNYLNYDFAIGLSRLFLVLHEISGSVPFYLHYFLIFEMSNANLGTESGSD
jgi:hypothetical protein